MFFTECIMLPEPNRFKTFLCFADNKYVTRMTNWNCEFTNPICGGRLDSKIGKLETPQKEGKTFCPNTQLKTKNANIHLYPFNFVLSKFNFCFIGFEVYFCGWRFSTIVSFRQQMDIFFLLSSVHHQDIQMTTHGYLTHTSLYLGTLDHWMNCFAVVAQLAQSNKHKGQTFTIELFNWSKFPGAVLWLLVSNYLKTQFEKAWTFYGVQKNAKFQAAWKMRFKQIVITCQKYIKKLTCGFETSLHANLDKLTPFFEIIWTRYWGPFTHDSVVSQCQVVCRFCMLVWGGRGTICPLDPLEDQCCLEALGTMGHSATNWSPSWSQGSGPALAPWESLSTMLFLDPAIPTKCQTFPSCGATSTPAATWKLAKNETK